MKKVAMILALSLFGAFAHAEEVEYPATPEFQTTPEIQADANDVSANALAWVCGLHFKGSAKGVKIIFGHFKTVAYGTLACTSVFGGHFKRRVMITMGHHWFSPTVGIGYFKYVGAAPEISLFNCSPDRLFGKYKVAEADAAVIAGAGSFTAVKLGLPQIAVAVSLKLIAGLGVHVGIDKMMITPLD